MTAGFGGIEIPKDFKTKSFWEKPEGTTGMFFLAALVIGGGYVLYKLLPFIITLLQNTIYAIILGVILFAIIYLLLDKRFQTLVSYGYKSIMRSITSWFITIDPIGILKNYVADLNHKQRELQQHITNLRGQMGALKLAIDKNEKMKKDSIAMAGQAKKKENQQVFVLQARKAGRLEKSNLSLSELFNKMDLLHRVLKKMHETCGFLLEDLESEVEVREREYNMIKTSYGAFKSAMKIIKGDTNAKDMFDQTMEYLAQDFGEKIGEISEFIDMSKNFIDTVDLQNGVYEDHALQELSKWEAKSQSLLISEGDKGLLLNNIIPTADTRVLEEVNVSDEYDIN